LSLGTSGVGFVVTPHYQPNAASATHAFCHAIPGRWHQMSVMLSAASCLQWVTHLVGAASESALAQQAEGLSTLQREQAPLFLPYLSGERTPHNDAKTRGSFHGLSFDTDVASLAYAVMEGVSFGLTDGLHALKAAGSTVKQMSLVGGGARSALWGQQLATLLDVPVLIHADSASGGALGAARLAWLAFKGAADGDADELAADLAAICPAPAVTHTYVPEASAKEALWTRYERFKALYPALKSVP
jgi:xylulokinase